MKSGRRSPSTGRRVGVPSASSLDAQRRMENQPQRDTRPEKTIRSLLHREGFRFFVDRSPLPDLRRRADILFPKAKIAVYVDGCFWHGCPQHGTWPKANAEWWKQKIETNRQRDIDTNARLAAAGWTTLRVWEHDEPTRAAAKISSALASRSAESLARVRHL